MKLWLLAALFAFPIDRLSPEFVNTLRVTTWHAGCPVGPEDLRVLTVPYWDYQGVEKEGRLIVNAEVADEVAAAFAELHAGKFPIQKMEPVELYMGDDERSMAANNTSAYNCRDKTGLPGQFSNHSWGRAIDINPLTNPYVKGGRVLPPGGQNYLDRAKPYVGGIEKDGMVVQVFRKRGWTWGGDWKDRKDYQHFEKPSR